MPRPGSLSAGLLALGLLAMLEPSAHAGGLSFSVAVPGAVVSANPAGATIGVATPGFYGQISVGDLSAPPQLIYAQPVIVEPAPRYVGAPIYLHVPPGYERHWAEHCREYHACSERVYFVRDDWYRDVYVRHHRYDPDHYRYRDHDGPRDFAAEHDRDYRRDHADHDRDRGWRAVRNERPRDDQRRDERGSDRRGRDDQRRDDQRRDERRPEDHDRGHD
jgi:hypothetical protein